MRCPSVRPIENVADVGKRRLQEPGESHLRRRRVAPPSLGGVQFRQAVTAGAVESDQGRRWSRTRSGFTLDCFLSPFESLATVVRQWKRADAPKTDRLHGRNHRVSVRAPGCSVQADRRALGVTPEGIAASCREDYDPDVVPAGASVVIGAVDVQDNRARGRAERMGRGRGRHRRRREQREGLGTRASSVGSPTTGSGIACDGGRSTIAASRATPARTMCGTSSRSSWRRHAGMRAESRYARSRWGSTRADTTRRASRSSARPAGPGYQCLKGLASIPPRRLYRAAQRDRRRSRQLRPVSACCWSERTRRRRASFHCCGRASRAPSPSRWCGRTMSRGTACSNSRAS